ncbi:spore cortex-lytic enzyme [Paenibacillus sp. y28]|uniref:spore cortex-lytic enzyme n=1 Tax=Paenibacillus sp. y28 TaxID=3129110 RepID=UPI0030165B6B
MNKRLIVIALSVTLLLVAGFHMKKHWSTEQTFSSATLKYGSNGEDVFELQGRLKLIGFYNGNVDGDFGSQTLQAVKRFQSEFGMSVDGIAGGKTKVKLWEATKHWTPDMTPRSTAGGASSGGTAGGGSGTSGGGSSTLAPVNNLGLSSQDLQLMANAVYGESRGEPYIGQIAVAAVIINRVKSASFPNTVSGVIFQPGAFTAVADGQIWLTPNETASKAVRDALNGQDPSGGCLYYFNPETATSKWIWTRPQVKQIGKHIFCK